MANHLPSEEKIKNALRQMHEELFEGRENELPQTPHAYRSAATLVLKNRGISRGKARRRKTRVFPAADAILRVYPSLYDAWREAGFRLERQESVYWTRERVVAGLKLFFEHFGVCPQSQEAYNELKQFTGKIVNSAISKLGKDNAYPSIHGISKYFSSMPEAWSAAGFKVSHLLREWTLEEDRFLLESVGILPRPEIAARLDRSEGGIKRRLYEFGKVTANERWGMSVTRAARETELGTSVILKYIEKGIIPSFKGSKNIYINPADLPAIAEFDTNSAGAELRETIRKCLVQRILKILLFGNKARDKEIYKFAAPKTPARGRKIRTPRLQSVPKPFPLKAGDWIKLSDSAAISVGIPASLKAAVKAVNYSPHVRQRCDGTERKTWIATCEFPRRQPSAGGSGKRIRRNIPFDCLILTDPPEAPVKIYKTNKEAIRQRRRPKFRVLNRRGISENPQITAADREKKPNHEREGVK